MKAKSFDLIRYDSDKGKVFDWREPRSHINEKGEEEQEHLYVRTLSLAQMIVLTTTLKFQQQTNPIGLSKKNFVKC